MVGILRKNVKYEFEKTVERVQQACMEEGFTVMLTKDVSEIFGQKLGVDYPKYVLVLACNAKLAKKALDISKDVGTLMPCSFVVYEDNDKTMVAHVSIMQAAVEVGLAAKEDMSALIEETSQGVKAIWNRI